MLQVLQPGVSPHATMHLACRELFALNSRRRSQQAAPSHGRDVKTATQVAVSRAATTRHRAECAVGSAIGEVERRYDSVLQQAAMRSLGIHAP